MDPREQLRQYLFTTLIPTPVGRWPADDADLYAHGLDSLRLMQLLVFIEDRIKVNLPDHELTPERTASVDAIAAWIAEHRR